jgi:hypothetical protein
VHAGGVPTGRRRARARDYPGAHRTPRHGHPGKRASASQEGGSRGRSDGGAGGTRQSGGVARRWRHPAIRA